MAKAIRRNNAVKLLGVTRRNRPYLMMSTALQATVAVVISFPAAALSPNAQPTGGTVQAGNIGISQNSTTTTIDQATQKGIIQWQQFNVGSQQTVQFNVPSAASSTLNRVVSPNPSQIAGKINSNGQVIIENQSGVMFLDGAQINTNGLMATAIGISDRNYLAGKMVLDRGGNPNAQVVNQGTITIAGAGLAALVAPAVRNSGTINAKMGNVVLAGGQAVTLDMYGDGLVSVNVTKQVTQAPDGVTSLVTNDGTIRAAGGTVQLTAAAADGVVQNLVTAGGKISARSMGEKTGTVSIAGIGGNIEITGQIGAEGIAAGTVGGTIAMTATGNVAVKGTAVVNASGKAGGGTVSIGTMPDRTRTATNTRIAAGATIKADATDKGNGGTVVVLSDAATSMAGSISAKGGPNGGNGGFVEVSGNTGFSLTGKIDVSAGKGVQGTILIDPQDLEIKAAGANDGDVAAGGVDVATPDQDTDRSVSAAVLTALNGSLVIEASRDLTVNADLVFANQTAGKSVTMLAGRDFTVNNAISTAGGDLTLKAAVSTDGVTAFTHFDAAGKLTINAAIGDASTGAINLSAGTGGIALAANVTTPATLSLVSTGAIAQTNGVVSADTLTGSSDTGASLTKANTVNKLGAFTNTTSGLLSVTNNQALTTTGAVTSGGDTTLTTTAGSLTLGANVSSGAAKTVTLNAFTSLSQTGGVISGDTLTGSSDTGASLTKANTVNKLGAFTNTTSGLLTVTNNQALTTTGAVTSGGDTTLTTTAGSLTLGANVSSGAAKTVTLNAFTSLSQTGGVISGDTLTGSSDTGASLTKANTVNKLGAFTNTTSGLLTVTNNQALTTTGAVTSGGDTTLTTTAGSLTLGANVSSGAAKTVTLNAFTSLSQTGGVISGDTLTGSSDTGASLTKANTVNKLGAFTNTTSGLLTVTNNQALTTTGAVTSGGDVALTTTTGSLTLGAKVASGAGKGAALTAAGTISDSGGTGVLSVGTLSISTTAAGNVSLVNVANKIGTISLVSLNNGGITVIDDPTLVLSGAQSATSFFYKVAVAGESIQLGDGVATPLVMNAGSGRISLIADGFAQLPSGGANKLTTTGVVEIAPLSTTVAMSLGGTTNPVQIDSTLLSNISAGTLIAGSYLSGGTTVTAASVLLDGNVSAGTLRIATLGSVAQTAGVATVTSLGIDAGGAVDLSKANAIGTIAASVTAGGKSFALNNTATGLTVDTVTGIVGLTTNNGSIAVTTTTSGDLMIVQNVNAGTGTIGLVSAGAISQTGGVLTAAGLGVAAVNDVALTKANAVGTIAAAVSGAGKGFAFKADSTGLTIDIASGTTGIATNNGSIAVTTATSGDLTINQNINAGTGTVGLTSAGTIGQSGGVLTAAGLGTTSKNAVAMTKNNAVGTIAGTVSAAGQGFAFKNASNNLTIDIASGVTGITTNNGNVALTTATSGGQTLKQNIGAGTGTITLVSAGTIAQTAGILTAAALTGSAGGDVGLGSTNSIVAMLAFGVVGGDFNLVDGGSLSVAGSIGANNISLSAGTIGIANLLNASTSVRLGASAGGITESGSISAAALASLGIVVGGATLTGTNTIGLLGNFKVSGGNFSLTSTGSLAVPGTVVGPDIVLNAGTLSIAGFLNGSGTVALGASVGGISETGSISAATLVSNGTVAGGATLTGTNTIASLGNFAVSGGNFALTSTGSVNVAGIVTAPNIALNAGTVGIAGFVNGATAVALGASAGGITEAGSIAAATLVSSGTIAGDAVLNGSNTIASIGGFNLTGTMTLKDTVAPTVAGTVVGAAATIGVPSLTIASGGVLNIGSIAIATSAGGVAETGTGQIIANSISIVTTGAGAVSLTNKNNQILASNGIQVGNGDLILVDDPTLTLTGAFSGKNLFIQVTQGGDAIAIGAGSAATLTAASGGRISIIADIITENAASMIVATNGTVEIAPFSTTVAMSLAGASQLAVDSTLLAKIATGTLTIGQYTDVTNANASTTTAKNISLAGAVDLTGIAGTLNLQTLGSITEPTGPLKVATLTGNAVNGATLAVATNNIGTLTGFSASGLQLVNGGALVLGGKDTVGSGGTMDISTTSGAVTQGAGGTLIAGTLTSTGNIFGAASLLGTANQIGTIAGLTAGGTLVVVDSQALALAGKVSVGSGGTVDITTSAGGVTQANTGTLIAGTLTSTGNIFGAASLLGTANQIGTIAGLTSGGTLAVVDSQALTLAGKVSVGSGGTVDITTSAGGVTQANTGTLIAGTLTSTGNIFGAASLLGTANQIGTIAGLTSGGTLVVVDSQALALAGKVSVGSGGTVDITTSAGGVTQANTGTLIAGTLTSTGNIFGAASLLGTANQIGTIVGLTSGGTLVVVDSQALTLAGKVSVGSSGTVDITTSAGGVTQANTGTLIAGTLTSTGNIFGAASLLGTANQIGTIAGLTSGGTLVVVDSQALALAGKVSVGSGGTVDITTSAGGVTQANTGTLIAGTLTSIGNIFGAASLLGTANQIGTIAGLTSGGTLVVVDSQALALAGKVSVGSGGTVDITTSAGGVTQANTGTLIAGTLTSTGNIFGAASLLGTANQIGTIAGLTSGGTLVVVDSQALALAGKVSVGSGGTVDITTSAGGVTQANTGTLIAGTLTSTGNIVGALSLKGTTNQIGALSNLIANGGITIVDNMGLTLANTVSGSSSTVDITTSVGGITQATGAVLIAGTLTSAGGLAGTTALLGTNNRIASINTLVVGSGSLALNDNVALNVNTNGKLSAHQIAVTALSKAITLANGVQIVTDGILRPLGPILPTNLPTSTSNSNGGAYFSAASFAQSRVLNVSNLSGAANILRVDTTGATQLDPGTGVSGANTWLILGLTNGAVATGVINVKALDVSYSGALGSASLSGTINNLTGQGAAGAANIVPAANANYKMNACAISSVNCVLLPSQGIPQHNPTSEIVFAAPYIPSVDDNQDIVVPLVTDTNDTFTIGNDNGDDNERNRQRSSRR